MLGDRRRGVAGRRGLLLHRALRHRHRRWFTERRAATSRSCTSGPSRRSSTCPTARTRTSAPPTTSRSARARTCSARSSQHHGKQISYNNLLDLDSARSDRPRLRRPGVRDRQAQQPVRRGGGRRRPQEAYARRFACDPLSAYGGIIALNRRSTARPPRRSSSSSSRCSSPRASTTDALEILTQKPNVRLLEDQERRAARRSASPTSARSRGGLLVQDRDHGRDERERRWRSPPSRAPDRARVGRPAVRLARRARHVKSNAIVLARDLATVGIGAGQMSRVDSVRIAVEKSGRHAQGSVLASDAFFPFADGPELAIRAGVTAIIQPGGSVRDDEVVAAADEARRRDGPHRAPPLPPLSRAAPRLATHPARGRTHVGYSRVVRAGAHVWVAGLHVGRRARRRAGRHPGEPMTQAGWRWSTSARPGARRRERWPTSCARGCS